MQLANSFLSVSFNKDHVSMSLYCYAGLAVIYLCLQIQLLFISVAAVTQVFRYCFSQSASYLNILAASICDGNLQLVALSDYYQYLASQLTVFNLAIITKLQLAQLDQMSFLCFVFYIIETRLVLNVFSSILKLYNSYS